MANVNFMRGDNEKMDNTAIMDGLIFLNTEENEMFLDDDNTRKQFSGAGHIIENNAGTDMAKRRNMQFKGAYVEDDSENNRTKVNVIRKMTDTEFSQLTEAEKQGIIKTTTDNNLPFDATMVEYENTQSGLSSTTVQGAIDELNSDISKITPYELITDGINTPTIIPYPAGFTFANCTFISFQVVANTGGGGRYYDGYKQGHDMYFRDNGIEIDPKDSSFYSFRIMIIKL